MTGYRAFRLILPPLEMGMMVIVVPEPDHPVRIGRVGTLDVSGETVPLALGLHSELIVEVFRDETTGRQRVIWVCEPMRDRSSAE
jgi:hypothetical protein